MRQESESERERERERERILGVCANMDESEGGKMCGCMNE